MKIPYKPIEYIALAMLLGMSLGPSNHTSASRINHSPTVKAIKEQADSSVSTELILLWNNDVKKDEQLALLDNYKTQIRITSEFDNFMLLSVATQETAEKLYQELSNSNALTAVDFNQEVNLSYTNDT